MATGYTVSGRGDLDALFKARTSAARPNVGFQVAGVDLASRYEPRGSTTAIAATGFVQSGQGDLAGLFMNIDALPGSTEYGVTLGTGFSEIGFRSSALSGAYGSISLTTFKSVRIDYITSAPDNTFMLQLQGSRAANFFTQLRTKTRHFTPQYNGLTVDLTSAAATFTDGGSYSQWVWPASLVNSSQGMWVQTGATIPVWIL